VTIVFSIDHGSFCCRNVDASDSMKYLSPLPSGQTEASARAAVLQVFGQDATGVLFEFGVGSVEFPEEVLIVHGTGFVVGADVVG
jgi:hypothetical protein